MKQKLAIAGAAIVGAFAPMFAFAQSFSTTSAETIAEGKVNDLGAFLTAYLPAVLGVFVGLLALGLGIYYLRKYIARHRG